MLSAGSYFGEVAFVYDCRRTSTVKAKLYATLGVLDYKTMFGLMNDHPMFHEHMRNDIIKVYDDDLKLFLMNALKRVDYLKDASDEILVQLAYSCIPDIKEKGAFLRNVQEDLEQQINDDMIIIFDGMVELFITMDSDIELQIELLPTGSVINSHNMLTSRRHIINARFVTNTSFYYLKYAKLVEVALAYP